MYYVIPRVTWLFSYKNHIGLTAFVRNMSFKINFYKTTFNRENILCNPPILKYHLC